MTPIYLDNNATTPLVRVAQEAMQPYLAEQFGNPSSSHVFGRQARRALEDAREEIAGLLDAEADEVLFTSGATEANNLALFGLAGQAPGSIWASSLEHPSVLEPIAQLESRGFRRAEFSVLADGTIDETCLSIPEDIRLAAVMLANHETGAVQPVATIARRLEGMAAIHCDAAAAAGKMAISFRNLGVTSLTISAHKFHGPKGIGALIVRERVKLRPALFGGHQQNAKRPGTEPVALAVGMAEALAWSLENLETHRRHLRELRQQFLEHLRAHAAPIVVNGSEDGGLPHALNISFPGCNADALLMSLDLAGVACSTGSACSSGSLLPSPVLTAMGTTKEALHSAMRFSLSPLLSSVEIDDAAQRIVSVVRRLRTRAIDESE